MTEDTCDHLFPTPSEQMPASAVHQTPDQQLTYGVLVLVRVNASVHDASEQVVHDAGQRLGVQHAMQCADKHRLTGVQTLGGAAHIVTVGDHPGDHLHL